MGKFLYSEYGSEFIDPAKTAAILPTETPGH
jgi:hypothetical protein